MKATGRNLAEDTKIVKSFLAKMTKHQADTAVLSAGKKSTYLVRVLNEQGKQVEVNFWLSDTDIAYGIVGFGICTNQPIENFK